MALFQYLDKYGKELRVIVTLLGEVNVSKSCCFLSATGPILRGKNLLPVGSSLKGKNLLLMGSNVFLLGYTLSRSSVVFRKAKRKSKQLSPM